MTRCLRTLHFRQKINAMKKGYTQDTGNGDVNKT